MSILDQNKNEKLFENILENKNKNEKVFESFDEETFSEIDDESEYSEIHCGLSKTTMNFGMVDQPEFEINRFFNELPIRILNSHQIPFFYVEDVARVLGIKRIRASLRDLSEKEIVSQAMRQKYNITTYKKYKDTFRPNNTVILVTEFGVYRLIMNSRSQLADKFRDFVYDVLYQLRTVGEYKIKAKLEQLETINETVLAENGLLKQSIDDCHKRISEFKNLCEEIVLIEFKNNPYEIMQTNIPSCSKKKSNGGYSSSKKHNTIDNPIPMALTLSYELGKTLELKNGMLVLLCDRKAVNAENFIIAHQFIKDNSPPNSYLVTTKPTAEQLTNGTVIYKVFVKDQQLAMKKLSKLHEFKPLNAKNNSNYFTCDKEKIITAMNAIAD